MTFNSQALHPEFGLEIQGISLQHPVHEQIISSIRDHFETHSLLLFRNQNLDELSHFKLASYFGPVENRSPGRWGMPRNGLSMVSNLDQNNRVLQENQSHVINLKANQLWHTDSTFLPVPALANILAAKVVTTSGGETELVSTRAAFRDMPLNLQQKARTTFLYHRYSHSRQKIDPDVAEESMFTMWQDQCWRAVWRNPVNDLESLYLASHAFAVDGMDDISGQALIEEMISFCTKEKYVYSHKWREGDVLIWDERATMHRGRPWSYSEPRSLASLCVTAQETDGLESIRPLAGSQLNSSKSF